MAIKEIQIPQDMDKQATNKAWEDEARALKNIKELNHPHITKCIAAIRRGERRYFMFPWADGGNLLEHWKQIGQQSPNPTLVRQTIEQLRGIADALDTLHNCDNSSSDLLKVPTMQSGGGNKTVDNEKSIRHGDLKPENILRFLPDHGRITNSATGKPRLKTELGILKIADMGLAKQHVVATQLRTNTSQRYGTIRYEAPEAITQDKGRSRLYDIWSMGCITLEFIIWILHGNDKLEDFHAQVEADRKQTCQYFELREGSQHAEVHHVVAEWINRIRISDPECSQDTAIRDLLDVVQNRLLVVDLDPTPTHRKDSIHSRIERRESVSQYRATAAEFRRSLDAILSKMKQGPPSYICTGKSRNDIRLPLRNDHLTPAALRTGVQELTFNPRYDTSGGRTTVHTGRMPRLEYSVGMSSWHL